MRDARPPSFCCNPPLLLYRCDRGSGVRWMLLIPGPKLKFGATQRGRFDGELVPKKKETGYTAATLSKK